MYRFEFQHARRLCRRTVFKCRSRLVARHSGCLQASGFTNCGCDIALAVSNRVHEIRLRANRGNVRASPDERDSCSFPTIQTPSSTSAPASCGAECRYKVCAWVGVWGPWSILFVFTRLIPHDYFFEHHSEMTGAQNGASSSLAPCSKANIFFHTPLRSASESVATISRISSGCCARNVT